MIRNGKKVVIILNRTKSKGKGSLVNTSTKCMIGHPYPPNKLSIWKKRLYIKNVV